VVLGETLNYPKATWGPQFLFGDWRQRNPFLDTAETLSEVEEFSVTDVAMRVLSSAYIPSVCLAC
jgi:hypothetical protein